MPADILRALRRRLVPTPTHSLGRYLRSSARDLLDRAAGRRDPLVPPTRWMFDGSQGAADYRSDGAEFREHFIALASLRPDERVLEIGCGIGRMAVALTGYLEPPGSYDGFDLVRLGVDWCQRQVTPRFPHFRFHHADVRNRLYNPGGTTAPEAYRFPFPDGRFDLVVATSVFTHVLPATLERYVEETSRVLAPGGRLFASFLLLNAESQRGIEERRSTFTLPHPHGVARTESAEVPEGAVGYPEWHVRDVLAKSRLTPCFAYGSWSGRSSPTSFQDLVVATRS